MAGQLTIDTLKASTGVLATQNGMSGIAKAWVNFNGNSSAIAGSFNVSSITYVSSGVNLINFTTAMPDANYAAIGMSGDAATYSDNSIFLGNSTSPPSLTTTQCKICTSNFANSFNNKSLVCVAFFR